MEATSTRRPLADFAFEIGRLRFIKRDFYIDGIPNSANVAEHIFRVATLAWMIAEREGANVGEVLKMALAHDMPEIRTLDHGIISGQYNEVKEEQAAQDLLGVALPGALEAFHAYEARLSPEAKIVKDADLLDIVLECKEFKMRGVNYLPQWDEELALYPSLLSTPTARQIHEDIQASHPHEFMTQLHRNRINKLKNKTSLKLKVA